MAICAELKRATPTVPVGSLDELCNIFKDPVVATVIDQVRQNLDLSENSERAGLTDKAKEYKKQQSKKASRFSVLTISCKMR